MDHAEHAAKINKRTVACERLDNALVTLANLALCPKRLALSSSLLLEHAADRTDGSLVSSALRNLDKSEINVLTYKILKALVSCCSCLRSRDKYSYAVIKNDNAALYSLCYLA